MRDLILGVLPSDKTLEDPSFGQAARTAARRTWVHAAPRAVTVRFVVMPSESDSAFGDTVTLPPSNTSCKCALTVQRWFEHAVAVWPTAEWYGKTEDDIYVQSSVLHWELVRLPRDPMLWYGLMAWTGNGDAQHPDTGCWGGQFEDDVTMSSKISQQLLGKERACPQSIVMAPSPMHQLDVRGHGLATALAVCSYPHEWLAALTSSLGTRKCGNECACTQGHWVQRCVSGHVKLAHVCTTARPSPTLTHPLQPSPQPLSPPLKSIPP